MKYLPMKICSLTVLLKSGLPRFTSPIKIVFSWNIVLSSQCQIFIKKISEIEVMKKDVKIFFDVSYNFQNILSKLFTKYYRRTSITCKKFVG